MRTPIYLIAAVICLLYGMFYSNENGLIFIGFLFVILSDINEIKEELKKNKKP
jgi:hypothetical protein